MKTLILAMLAFSNIASAAVERDIVCTGRWSWMKKQTIIQGTVVGNEMITDLSDSNGNVEHNQIEADTNYNPRKYEGYNRFSYYVDGDYEGDDYFGEGHCNLLLPKNVSERTYKFTAYNICQQDQNGGTLTLTCKISK